MNGTPRTLDHAGIAARIPHRGAMCLLDSLLQWSADTIVCRIVGHADPEHPLRLGGRLPAACALEYAGQAMALHGALCAPPRQAPRPGFLASARGVRLHVPRLDDCAGPLQVQATRLASDGGHALYRFVLADHSGRALVDGRAAVVLNQALVSPGA
jgi:predicted hotdog family 3-hydroxylacyl-ACP dehydratase